MIGRRFGNLVVMELLDERTQKSNLKYLCQCDCGKMSKVPGKDLRSGNTKTCGCSRRSKNGLTANPLYKRCAKAYERTHTYKESYHKSYSERNIEFKFESILEMYQYLLPMWEEAMKHHPINRELQVDRINNELGYEAGNLRITTRTINNRNRSNTVRVTAENVKTHEKLENVLLWGFCEKRGLNYKTLLARYRNNAVNPRTDNWIIS